MERMIYMNISSISSAIPDVNMSNMSMMASIQVLDMAQNVFEDAAAQLIDALSAVITGVGHSVDMYV